MEGNMLVKRIASLLNRRVLPACLLFGFTFPIFVFFLQVVMKRSLLGIVEPPTVELIAGGIILFFLAGFLFSFGYFLFLPYLPGKTAVSKALLYGLLIGFGLYFGNIVNFIAFDPAGGTDPFSMFKITHFATAVADLLNFLINSWLLSVVAGRMNSSSASDLPPRKLAWMPSLAGTIVFPAVGFLAWILFAPAFGVGYLVPSSWGTWFHLTFWIPLGLTCGVAIPLLYQIAEPLLSGNRLAKTAAFTLLHYGLYWVALILFIIPLSGMTWRDAFFFFAIAPPAIFAAALPAARGDRVRG
jgi:hypothetical protein